VNSKLTCCRHRPTTIVAPVHTCMPLSRKRNNEWKANVIYIYICAMHTYGRKRKEPRWMNDLNRTDPDNSARHIYSAVIDVFNRTVIMTCTTVFNRSTRLASQSTIACSLSFFPLASSCWRTTRLLQHTHAHRLASDHIAE